MQLLDIKMTASRVSLQPESNRVLTALDVALDAPLPSKFRAKPGELFISLVPQAAP